MQLTVQDLVLTLQSFNNQLVDQAAILCRITSVARSSSTPTTAPPSSPPSSVRMSATNTASSTSSSAASTAASTSSEINSSATQQQSNPPSESTHVLSPSPALEGTQQSQSQSPSSQHHHQQQQQSSSAAHEDLNIDQLAATGVFAFGLQSYSAFQSPEGENGTSVVSPSSAAASATNGSSEWQSTNGASSDVNTSVTSSTGGELPSSNEMAAATGVDQLMQTTGTIASPPNGAMNYNTNGTVDPYIYLNGLGMHAGGQPLSAHQYMSQPNIVVPNVSFMGANGAAPFVNGGTIQNSHHHNGHHSHHPHPHHPHHHSMYTRNSMNHMHQQNLALNVCKFFLQGHCARGEQCNYAHVQQLAPKQTLTAANGTNGQQQVNGVTNGSRPRRDQNGQQMQQQQQQQYAGVKNDRYGNNMNGGMRNGNRVQQGVMQQGLVMPQQMRHHNKYNQAAHQQQRMMMQQGLYAAYGMNGQRNSRMQQHQQHINHMNAMQHLYPQMQQQHGSMMMQQHQQQQQTQQGETLGDATKATVADINGAGDSLLSNSQTASHSQADMMQHGYGMQHTNGMLMHPQPVMSLDGGQMTQSTTDQQLQYNSMQHINSHQMGHQQQHTHQQQQHHVMTHHNSHHHQNHHSQQQHHSHHTQQQHHHAHSHHQLAHGYVTSPMSDFLSKFTATSSAEELTGHIYMIAKDQYGCRLLQRMLDEQKPHVCDLTYTEVFDHMNELMTDPFGNYLCQKLIEHCNNEQRFGIIQKVSPDLVAISLNMHGTRAVQKLVETISTPKEVELVIEALRTSVVTLIKDLNGNHVVQRCLHHLNSKDNQFIYDAVSRHCVSVATHKHGCCVMQRTIRYANIAQKRQLVLEIVANALELVQDAFDVVQYILDLGEASIAQSVLQNLLGHISSLSVQKFSSNVVEKCLELSNDKMRMKLIDELLNPERLPRLLQDPYANYVIQKSLSVCKKQQFERLVSVIKPHLLALRNTTFGKRIQTRILKKFPDLNISFDALASDSNEMTPLVMNAMVSSMSGMNAGNHSNDRNHKMNGSTNGVRKSSPNNRGVDDDQAEDDDDDDDNGDDENAVNHAPGGLNINSVTSTSSTSSSTSLTSLSPEPMNNGRFYPASSLNDDSPPNPTDGEQSELVEAQ